METQSTITTKVIGGIVAIGVLAGVANLATKEKIPEPTPTQNTQDTGNTDTVVEPETPSTVNANTYIYRDGSYSATGTYRSPAGSETVAVTLVVKDDTITEATFDADSTSSQSLRYQAQFKGGYTKLVVGKKLSELNVGKVSGSSLTGKGFMDAVAKIKAEAHI